MDVSLVKVEDEGPSKELGLASPRRAETRVWSVADSALEILLALLLYDEQDAAVRAEAERLARLEREALDDDYRQKLEMLHEYHRRLQSDYAEVDETDRQWLKRARLVATAVGSAVATQQSVQRQVWTVTRSQAWWDRCNDPSFPEEEFRRAFRMGKGTFNHVCTELQGVVGKENTPLRAAIPVRQRVAVCLWRLASGEPFRLVAKRFGLGISTCQSLVLQVCAAINTVLLPRYIQWPVAGGPGGASDAPDVGPSAAQAVAAEFERLCGVAGVVGVVHTTHIIIAAPKANVAAYFNKRLTERNQGRTAYSVTVQATVDSRGAITDVCIGWPGSLSDDHILRSSALFQRGLSGGVQGRWVVGSQNFPLLDWLLVPYALGPDCTWAQQALNEKLEEALVVARNAFGRLKGRWKFLQRRTEVKIQQLPAVLGACCVLHNICERRGEGFDEDLFFPCLEENVHADLHPLPLEAVEHRDAIAQSLLLQSQTEFL